MKVARLIPLVLLLGGGGAYAYKRYRDAHAPYEWSGTVEAHVVYIGSRVGGRVREVKVREGDVVKKGDPLIVLEPGDLLAQRLGASGQLEQAQANLDKLEKGARPEEIDQARARAQGANAALQETRSGPRQEEIDAAKARLAAAQVAVDKAKLDNDRVKTLIATQSISQAEADNADAALRGASAQRDAAKVTLEQLENGARREQIAQAAAVAQEANASAKLVSAGARVEDLDRAPLPEVVRLLAEGDQADRGALLLLLAQERAHGAVHVRVEPAGKALVAAHGDHDDVLLVAPLEERMSGRAVLVRGDPRRDGGERRLERRGVGTRREDAVLRAAQLRRRDHLHRLRDLLRVLHAADPAPDVDQVGHGRAARLPTRPSLRAAWRGRPSSPPRPPWKAPLRSPS